jgi:hypothetical protein
MSFSLIILKFLIGFASISFKLFLLAFYLIEFDGFLVASVEIGFMRNLMFNSGF